MALTNYQWLSRMGMVTSLVDQVPDQNQAMRYVGLLAVWRFFNIMTTSARQAWDAKVSLKASGALFAAVRGRKELPDKERAFWSELYSKKVGLFGHGSGADVSWPTDLVKHPWALSSGEFKGLYSTITGDITARSLNIPDDSARVKAVAALIAGGATASVAARAAAIAIAKKLALRGAAATVDPEPITKTVISLIALGTAVTGATWLWQIHQEQNRWDKLVGGPDAVKSLREVYEREAEYRQLENF